MANNEAVGAAGGVVTSILPCSLAILLLLAGGVMYGLCNGDDGHELCHNSSKFEDVGRALLITGGSIIGAVFVIYVVFICVIVRLINNNDK